MTLQEALNSGRAFARAEEAALGEYSNAEDFLAGGISLEDYNATDYELEPETEIDSISEAVLIDAWNNSKPASVALASESEFYKRFKNMLIKKNIVVA